MFNIILPIILSLLVWNVVVVVVVKSFTVLLHVPITTKISRQGTGMEYIPQITTTRRTRTRGLYSHTTNISHNDSNHNNNELLILGLGRVGYEVAKQAYCTKQFYNITGTIRNNNNNEYDEDEYCHRIVFNNNNNAFDTIIKTSTKCSHILITIPPPPLPLPLSIPFSNTTVTTNTSIVENENSINEDDYSLNDLYDRLLIANDELNTNVSSNNSNNNTIINNSHINNKNKNIWIGIISTTGVYGNHNGNWVNETSSLLLMVDNSTSMTIQQQRYIQYESEWIRRIQLYQQKQNNNQQYTLYIFRCAGIYSNTQSALHTLYKNGIIDIDNNDSAINNNNNINKNNHTAYNKDITNRIHVHDLAIAVVTSMLRHSNSNNNNNNHHDNNNNNNNVHVYNLADNQPESRTIVMQYAKQLFQQYNITIPNSSSISTSSSIKNNNTTGTGSYSTIRNRRRQNDQKRISNYKMKHELLVSNLQYPTYKEGLDAIFNDPHQPWWNNQ